MHDQFAHMLAKFGFGPDDVCLKQFTDTCEAICGELIQPC